MYRFYLSLVLSIFALPLSSFAAYYDSSYYNNSYYNQNYNRGYNYYQGNNNYYYNANNYGTNPYLGYYDTYQNQGYYNTTDSTIQALWDLVNSQGNAISKSITDTSNGVIFTLSSSDAYVSSRLQTINYDGMKSEIYGKNMYVSKDNHWNGVQVQVTSSDYETVYKIQEYVRGKLGFAIVPRPKPLYPNTRLEPRYDRNPGYYPPVNYYPQPYIRSTDVVRSISNLNDGATIVITSTDPTMINYIQSYPRSFVPNGLGNNVSISIINSTLGIQIRMTSPYRDIVDRIQYIVNSEYQAPNGFRYVNR